ncbi:MAG: hypothetical protein ABIH70_00450 [Chloroflexota bacterium]
MTNNEPSDLETRQERRAKKLRKKRERIPQHGKSLAKIYKNTVTKRAKEK